MGQYLANAELVVEGKVLEETFAVRNSQTGSIETVHTIVIDRVLKGSAPYNNVEVHTPGGRLDDIIESVSHGSTLGGGQQGIFLLSSNTSGASLGNSMGGYHLHGGNAGKITRLRLDDDYEAIHWGELDKYKSWRQLREQVGASLGVDLTIHPITEAELQSLSNPKEFCIKLDNPVPNVEDMTVEFDVMAKSSVAGLKFARAEVLIDYPTGNLGGFIVDQEKIEAEKGDITDGSAYTVAIEDKSENQIELSIESPCNNNEPHYVLDTVYEKLATLTIEVNEWADLGTMNVDEFAIAGVAEFVNPQTLQGTPGCTEFEDLCGEGEFGIFTCAVSVQQGGGPQGAGVFDKVTFTGLRYGDPVNNPDAFIVIPNADDGGASSISIPINDVNHIDSWTDTEIIVNIGSIAANPDYPEGSPFASGTWIIHPDINDLTLSCSAGVRVDYALDNANTIISGGGGNRHKMIAMAQADATPTTGTNYDWEYYIDGDIITNNLLPPNLTASDFEDMVERVICSWEIASGLELTYGGFQSKSNPPHARASFITFVPTAAIGNRVAFTTITKSVNSFCRAQIAAPDYFGELRLRSLTEISNDFGLYVGSGTVPLDKVDLESVLLHEIGHSLLMKHEWNGQLGDTGQGIMYFDAVLGQSRRDIDSDNTFGIQLERIRTSAVVEPNPRTCFPDYYLDTNLSGCTLSPVNDHINREDLFSYNTSARVLSSKETNINSDWIFRGYDLSGRLINSRKFSSGERLEIDPAVEIISIINVSGLNHYVFKTMTK